MIYPAQEWAQFYALEVSDDWHPICQECVEYVGQDYVVNYCGTSPHIYTCQLCRRPWSEFLVEAN